MLDLAHIRKLAHAATKGPWTVGQRWEDEDADMANWLPINRPAVDPDNPHQPERVALIRYYPGGFQHPHYEARSDAEFIAAARELVPAMADEIERLRREVAETRIKPHVPTLAPALGGTFGVHCIACSDAAQDYIWPCSARPNHDNIPAYLTDESGEAVRAQ